MTSTPTRRKLLAIGTSAAAYAAGAAVVAGGAAIASEARGETPETKSTAWDAAVRRFKIADAMKRANDAFGKGVQLAEEHERVKARAAVACGSFEAGKNHPEHGPKLKVAWIAVTEADDHAHRTFIAPADAAAVALVLTPAPDPDALLYKVEVVKAYELDNFTDFPGDPFDHIAAEAKRLAGEALA